MAIKKIIDDQSDGDQVEEESPQVSSSDDESDDDTPSPKSGVGSVAVSKDSSKGAKPKSDSVMDYQKYLITPDDIDSMTSAKRGAAVIGSLGNSFGNQQSAGNFYLGHLNPKTDNTETTKMLASAAEAPIKAKQTLMAQSMKKPQMDLMAQMQDPTSMPSKLISANALSAISQIKTKTPEQEAAFGDLKGQLASGKLNGYQIKNVIDNDPLLKESFTASIAGQKMDQMFAMMQNRQQNQGELAAQRAVNSDKILSTYIPRLDGASKIMGLIQAGERGEFKTNKALLGQLNAEIGRLETGSQSPGLGASEKTEMSSVAANLSDLRDSLTGGVTGVDLSKKFAQAKGMVADLGKSYYGQIDDRIDSLKSGANLPGQADVFASKQKTMQDIYKKRFGDVGVNIAGGGQQGGGLINSANAGEGMSAIQQAAQAELQKRKSSKSLPTPMPSGG